MVCQDDIISIILSVFHVFSGILSMDHLAPDDEEGTRSHE